MIAENCVTLWMHFVFDVHMAVAGGPRLYKQVIQD